MHIPSIQTLCLQDIAEVRLFQSGTFHLESYHLMLCVGQILGQPSRSIAVTAEAGFGSNQW
jgi:hypothetical protein